MPPDETASREIPPFTDDIRAGVALLKNYRF